MFKRIVGFIMAIIMACFFVSCGQTVIAINLLQQMNYFDKKGIDAYLAESRLSGN